MGFFFVQFWTQQTRRNAYELVLNIYGIRSYACSFINKFTWDKIQLEEGNVQRAAFSDLISFRPNFAEFWLTNAYSISNVLNGFSLNGIYIFIFAKLATRVYEIFDGKTTPWHRINICNRNEMFDKGEKFYVQLFYFSALEYCLNVENMNLSAIRTIRVLRPLRAINRIPSEYAKIQLDVYVEKPLTLLLLR